MKLVIFLLSVMVFAVSFAEAEVVNVPLPGFVGTYSGVKTASFDAGTSFEYIGGAKIKLTGQISPGLGCGDGVEKPVFPYFDWWGSASFIMDPTPGEPLSYWHVSIGDQGSFSVEKTFVWRTPGEPTWDFLLDGQGEITLYFSSQIVIGGIMIYPPSLTITSASLLIAEPLNILSPNGDEFLLADSTSNITWRDWRDQNCGGDYLLYYTVDNGDNWIPITQTPVSNTCEYEWTVPAVDSNECLIRIVDANNADINDVSDESFYIYQCIGPLTGDINGDCYVKFDDYCVIASQWGEQNCGDLNEWRYGSDLSQNGAVDWQDIFTFVLNWCDCGNHYDLACYE